MISKNYNKFISFWFLRYWCWKTAQASCMDFVSLFAYSVLKILIIFLFMFTPFHNYSILTLVGMLTYQAYMFTSTVGSIENGESFFRIPKPINPTEGKRVQQWFHIICIGKKTTYPFFLLYIFFIKHMADKGGTAPT